MALLTTMSTKGKLALGGCVLAFLIAVVVIMKVASAPSLSTIQTGIDPAQASKITAALDEKGVAWELQNGGTAVAVDKAQVTAARVALAGAGLNTTQQQGFEILDKQKLGASNQQQQIAYQRGLEGEIANTISQIEGAAGSTVNLTLPKDDLFADEAKGATAAVLLGGAADNLGPGAVKGIANLVASSVPNLKTSGVTITDASGQMLWPSGGEGAAAGATGGLAAKPAAEAKYNAQVASSLNAMLAATLGANKASVQVTSDLNVDKASQEKLEYGDKAVALEETTDKETLQGSGGTAAGTSGTATNLPSYAGSAGGAAGGGGDYNSSKKSVKNGVDRTVTRTQVAPGAVNRLSVAVLVDKNAKPDLAALQRAVESAVGFDAKRGDTVDVQAIAFAKAPAATAAAGSPLPAGLAGPLKAVGIGVGALLFLFFVTRHLRKREKESLLDEPSWLRELEAARPQPAMLEMPQALPGVDQPTLAANDPRRRQLDQIIAEDPERVAAHLRGWITEDAR